MPLCVLFLKVQRTAAWNARSPLSGLARTICMRGPGPCVAAVPASAQVPLTTALRVMPPHRADSRGSISCFFPSEIDGHRVHSKIAALWYADASSRRGVVDAFLGRCLHDLAL